MQKSTFPTSDPEFDMDTSVERSVGGVHDAKSTFIDEETHPFLQICHLCFCCFIFRAKPVNTSLT